MKDKIEVVVGDYSAKQGESLLKRCEDKQTEFDGRLHAGVIHYIQGEMPDFTLKAAISSVLDSCPSVWPEDLPELVDNGQEVSVTKEMNMEFERMNKSLLLPVQGFEVAQIIRLGKKFLKVECTRCHGTGMIQAEK